jgi:hypothetical protein
MPACSTGWSGRRSARSIRSLQRYLGFQWRREGLGLAEDDVSGELEALQVSAFGSRR